MVSYVALDSRACYTFDQLGFVEAAPCGWFTEERARWAPPLDLFYASDGDDDAHANPDGHADQTDESDPELTKRPPPRAVSSSDFERLTGGCQYTPRTVFRSETLLRGYGLWGYSDAPTGGRGGYRDAIARFGAAAAQGLADGRTVRVVVRRCGAAGLGLFALEDIHEGALIGEYTGELVPFEEGLGGRVDEYTCRYPTRSPAALLSAARWGNAMRLINHGSGERANAKFDFVRARMFPPTARSIPHRRSDFVCSRCQVLFGGLMHIVVIAYRHITNGEQILIDYGPTYWRSCESEPIPL